MPRQVRTPDGVIHNFPDTATDAQISAALNSVATAPQTDQENALALAAAAGGGFSPMQAEQMSQGAGNLAIGAVKGAARTGMAVNRTAHLVPGVNRVLGTVPSNTDLGLDPTNTAQKIGMGTEQAAEFLVPAGTAERTAAAMTAKVAPYFTNTPRLAKLATKVVPRMITQGATNAGVAALQGSSAVTAGAISAALPVAGAIGEELSPFLRSRAEWMVRAAIKPTVTALKRVAGASAEGLDAKAKSLVSFIIDNRLVNADKARALFRDTETELKTLLAKSGSMVTDAAERARRYLTALERSAAKQGLPDSDVAQIRNAAAELLDGPMGTDVVTMVPTPHPTLVDPQGKPITVLMPQTTRTLRTDVTAAEALDSARASSRWSTNKQWGEQKGTATEANKAVERAQRDATKDALPESRALLQTESKAIQATDVLDRMQHRQANREAVGLPAHVLAAGGHGVLAFASNWIRNNGPRAGIWADRLSKAVANQNARQAAWILSELGVGVQAQRENPAYAK